MLVQLNEDQSEFRSHISRWVDERVVPVAEELDRENRFPGELFKELGELGYYGIHYPEKYGGAGLDYVSYMITLEELAKVCASTTLSLSAHISLASAPIERFGTEDQKEKYLRPLATGKSLGAFGLTEPQAGSVLLHPRNSMQS